MSYHKLGSLSTTASILRHSIAGGTKTTENSIAICESIEISILSGYLRDHRRIASQNEKINFLQVYS